MISEAKVLMLISLINQKKITVDDIKNSDYKAEVIKILDDTINLHSDESVKENARSVKSLLALS